MLNLIATTDKLQLISGQAADLDVHTSWMDYQSGSSPVPGKTNTAAITTATTTDIVAAPAASTSRNVKTIFVRNVHATASCDVTIQYNQNATIIELIKITLAAGDTLEYVEGVGFFKVPNPVNAPLPNVSTADQSIGASVTNYITNSDIRTTAGRPWKVGTVLRWHIVFSKTAAATASMTFDLRVGTAGTTADTSRGSLATGTQTAVADNAELEVAVTIRSIAASGQISYGMQMEHNLAATGLAPINVVVSGGNNTGADTTSAALIFGISLTTGASHAITITRVVAEVLGGTI